MHMYCILYVYLKEKQNQLIIKTYQFFKHSNIEIDLRNPTLMAMRIKAISKIDSNTQNK